MSEVGKLNSFDDSVSWWFHESYYEATLSFNRYRVTSQTLGKYSSTNVIFPGYLFSADQFGVGTKEYLYSFCDSFGYYSYDLGNYIVVLKEKYPLVYSDSEVRNNSDLKLNTEFLMYDDLLKGCDKFVTRNGLPGDRYYWSDSSETIGLDTDEENEGETGEGREDIIPGDDDTGSSDGDKGSDYEPVDVENLDDAVEILKEIYNAETSYHTEMLEVEQNGFDISVVSLSLNFCMVFLCGILVGCAFARSLWHKMNVG